MASFYGGGHGDFLQAVVADVGQAYTKVGWAGNDSPKAYFRSVRGSLSEVNVVRRLLLCLLTQNVTRLSRCCVNKRQVVPELQM